MDQKLKTEKKLLQMIKKACISSILNYRLVFVHTTSFFRYTVAVKQSAYTESFRTTSEDLPHALSLSLSL